MKALRIVLWSVSCLLLATMPSCTGSSKPQVGVAPAGSDKAQQAVQTPATQPEGLPEVITTFVQQYFPGTSVARIETDREFTGMEYDLTLSNGVEIDFAPDGTWEKVDCHGQPVPVALVPTEIAAYANKAAKGAPITKIEKHDSGYEIELASDMELKFDAAGNFLTVDD